MADIVWIDDDGSELKREVKGRGRPPKNSEKRDDGNFYVSPAKDDRFVPKYITLDSNGEVIEETNKGRGRPKPGFEKMDAGEHQGHWVKTDTDVA